jgi:hypothetical protein
MSLVPIDQGVGDVPCPGMRDGLQSTNFDAYVNNVRRDYHCSAECASSHPGGLAVPGRPWG